MTNEASCIDDVIHTKMLERLKEGDDDEWTNFYCLCYPGLKAIIRLKYPGCRHMEEEFINDAFVAFFQALNRDNFTWLKGKKLTPYLFQIALNKCRDYFRRHLLPVHIEDQGNDSDNGNMVEKIPAPNPRMLTDFSPDQCYHQLCLHQALQRARKRIRSKNTIRIFEQCGLDGLNPDDVAKSLAMNRHAVDEAKRKFQQILIDEFHHVLNEQGGNSSKNGSKKILEKTIRQVRKDRDFFAATMTQAGPNDNLIARIEFMAKQYAIDPPPQQAGDYIAEANRLKLW